MEDQGGRVPISSFLHPDSGVSCWQWLAPPSNCISFVLPRENQKMDYDQRLQQEVEALRTRTALEMEQLKTQTREMFERENR